IPLEIHPGVQNERAGAGRGRDTAETGAVNVEGRSRKERMVQDVDGIHPHLELLAFGDLDAFNQVHVEVERLWTLDPAQAEISERSRSWIHEQRVTVRIGDRKVAERALQRLRRGDAVECRILDLLEAGKVIHDSARLFSDRTHALR